MADPTCYCCPHCDELFIDGDEFFEHASICQFDTEAQLEHHGLPIIAPPDPLGEVAQ